MGLIRKTRIFLISAVAVTLIVLAVAFTVLRAMLPYATGYIAEIEQGISSQIGLPVSIGSLDADMYWLTPRLKLLNLVIYEENGVNELLHLREAKFSLAYIDSIRLMMPMVGSVSLHGAELTIERHPRGKWVIQGQEFQQGESTEASEDIVEAILSANLALIDSHIHWRDYTGKSKNMDLHDVTVLLENFLGTQYLEIELKLPDDLGDSLQLVAEIEGDYNKISSLEGLVHISGKDLVLENWVNRTRIKDYILASGTADMDVWLHVNNLKVTRFAGNLSATNLVLTNKDDKIKSWAANRLATNIYWRGLNEGWRLDVRDTLLEQSDSTWYERSDIVIARHEADWRVLASYVKLHDLLPILEILPAQFQPEVLADIKAYDISAELYNFEAIFSEGEQLDLDLQTAFRDVGFRVAEKNIALHGVDGHIDIDGKEATLRMSSNDSRVTIGDLFRWPLQFDSIEGDLNIKMVDDVITLHSEQLAAGNTHVETLSRLHAEISPDKKVYLDMQTNVANGRGEYAYKYVPASFLSEGLVDWLDNAFVGGYVPSGRFIFHGIANDYPFNNGEGVMEALFNVEDGTLHFLDGWPDVNHGSGTVRFHNASLTVENARSVEDHGGEAMLNANIPDLRNALLNVSGHVIAPALELQQYIWNSGLDSILGRSVEQFQASGIAEINLDLNVPLGERRDKLNEQLTAKGDLTFKDNEVFFPVTDYLVTRLNGKLSFTTNSLQGEGIKGEFYGQPVYINVKHGETNGVPNTQFHVNGNWHVNALLKKYDWDYPSVLDGTSHWEVVVHVPHKVTDYNVMFDAGSDLKGVIVGFSDTIHKNKETSLPISMQFRILGDAQSLSVNIPDKLDLVAHNDEEDYWQFNLTSPVMSGEGRLEATLDKNSTANFNLDYLNLSAFRRGDGATANRFEIRASIIPSIRLNTDKLDWKDWSFSNVSFEADHHPRGMVVNDFSIDDPHFQISGKGSWLRRSWRLDEETTLSFTMSSPNIGDTLQRLGYSRFVEGSDIHATLNWSWPGEPYNFSWGHLSGNTQVEMDNGIISDIDPGAGGRFLALFNILHLPKRLTLNFKDVYKEGFGFDAMSGSYIFADGDAITQDTEISASAADIKMMGRIGIEDQDYDLVSVVRPHASAATFAGGTIIGGPTIGVGLVLLQEMFGIDLLGKELYSVKGSWDEPVVESLTSPTETTAEEGIEEDEF